VPTGPGGDVQELALLEIVDTFRQRFPHIKPVSSQGLVIPGETMDFTPLMQIAGDIAPDVMFVNFRQSDTYIRSKFLHPLESYIEASVGAEIPGGHLLDLRDYLDRLRAAPGYEAEVRDRVPIPCWDVMRRRCPYGDACSYLDKRGEPPAPRHFHVWSYPIGPLLGVLYYRWDYFYEAGLPARPPANLDELLEWSRKLHNPEAGRYGLMINHVNLCWNTTSFLYAHGGRLVEQDSEGAWRTAFDSEAAVNAYYYFARLCREPFRNRHGEFDSSVYIRSYDSEGDDDAYAIFLHYLDYQYFGRHDPAKYHFGPVPAGPEGLRGNEFNSEMLGIYAGLEDEPAKRDAAWEYIRFYAGREARTIRARHLVEQGFGHFVRSDLLVAAGFPEYVRRVPREWEEVFRAAVTHGVPEPYGTNCQKIYTYVDRTLEQIRTDPAVGVAIRAFDETAAKARIREILESAVERTNRKMMNIYSPEETRFRNRVAAGAAAVIVVLFALLFRRVFTTFAEAQRDLQPVVEGGRRRGWQLARYGKAYLILLPALGLIAIWAYYPLARGGVMAFQDYNVRGFSQWVGMSNFANVLFDPEFWHAMWIALKYTILFMALGFVTPIILAFLLTAVPRGKILFRMIYYLPAVLSGVVVIFLWKGFYAPDGVFSDIVNGCIAILNLLPGLELEPVHIDWLESPRWALPVSLLPVAWAGMGPGCLIYLAALKTVPEELYEAAEVDGAGFLGKVAHIAVPGIRSLVFINFIGAVIGAMKGGGEFMLAMTGGGPYTPYGATEVVGLHIFWEAFAFLRFGTAVSMAWIVGSFLIGFTVLQLQRLSRMEFRTAGEEGRQN
jgi:multiple sugar transport system permease protein